MTETSGGPPGRDPSSLAWPRRVGAFLQGVTGAVLVAFAFLTAPFEKIYEQLEMRELPAPTQAFLALCGFLRRPMGLIGFSLLELVLMALILRGSLDRILQKWIVADAIGLTLLVPFYVLSVYLPIIRIQQSLAK